MYIFVYLYLYILDSILYYVLHVSYYMLCVIFRRRDVRGEHAGERAVSAGSEPARGARGLAQFPDHPTPDPDKWYSNAITCF